MEREELILKMRGRINMCRRLAGASHDPKISKTLLEMAAEGERDLFQLMTEGISFPSPKGD